ncbi:MAG: homocysteine S-methyltransferase family protein, partial [Lachnospiraceae bacterium]
MTKKEFKEMCTGHPIYLDGATGSMLQKNGMPSGICPEQWMMEHPDILQAVQSEYVKAGSQIIYAPTFTANRIKLQEYGLADEIENINQTLVAISRQAANGQAYVAGDLTMTGEQLAPIGKLDFEELVDIYREQTRILYKAGVDMLIIETMMSLQETRAAVIAARKVCELPIMVTMTYEADGRTLFGTDAQTAAIVLTSLGVDAIGANCSTGPMQMAEVIRKMAQVTAIPLIAKPNAGLPSLAQDGSTIYDLDAQTFASQMVEMVEAGAVLIGGCCGTSPAYIASMYQATARMPVQMPKVIHKGMLASERKSLIFDTQSPFMIVGERINPTGKKSLQAELKEGKLDKVIQFAEEQENSGADILDINMGMSGIDEEAMMLRVIEEVSQVTSLPLCIDSSHVQVIEQALRRYPGRALINSISLEKGKIEQLLPIARRYGAMFILLPLSEKGLPKNPEEKCKIIDTIVKLALKEGMCIEDIIVDGLVATVGANPSAAIETLQTIRYCKERGLATICGLSNISFGLPERGFVNAAFLTMAIQAGLTMAIANPNQQLLVSSAYAADVLLHKEGADIRYIEAMNAKNDAAAPDSTTTIRGEKTEQNVLEQLRTAVLKGNRNGIVSITTQAVAEGHPAPNLLNEILLPAINEVGDLFDKGTYFLPQLIASAESMKRAIEYLEPLLAQDQDRKEMPTIIIATVKG